MLTINRKATKTVPATLYTQMKIGVGLGIITEFTVTKKLSQ